MDTFDDSLEIPVTYKGQDLSLPAQVLMTGYTYKIQVDVDEHWIMFEPDEERNYRPVLDGVQLGKGIKLDINLLKEIAAVINSVVK